MVGSVEIVVTEKGYQISANRDQETGGRRG